MSHAVNDGGGALILFKTLLAVYLRELRYSVPNTHDILDVTEEPRRAKREDTCDHYTTVYPRREKRGKRAHQNNDTAKPFYTFNVTMDFRSVAQLKERVRGYGMSIIKYLTAVLLKMIADKQHRERPRRGRPVALAIPINLQGQFLSETLRNFILTTRSSIDPSPGEYIFGEVLSQVCRYLRLNISRQQMQATITGNVKLTTNRLLQLVPIMPKNPTISPDYKLAGVLPYLDTYTSPGLFPVPEEMVPHIHHMEVILDQVTTSRSRCVFMNYRDIMEITLTDTQKEDDIERGFFRFLMREDTSVKVESNRTE